MNKKITFVAATLGGGGAERVMTGLANEMVTRGHEVTIIVTAPTRVDYQLDERIRVITLKTDYKNKIVKIWRKLTQLRRIYRTMPEAALISFMPDVCIYNALATLGLPNQVIMSERSAPMCNPDQAYKRKLRTLSYFFADVCVFQTKGAKEYFPKFIQKSGVIIPNPLMKSMPEVREDEREKCIVIIGRIELSKNMPMFIDGMELFHREHPEYIAKVFGVGAYKAQMQEMVQQKDLQNVILFEDFSKNIYEELNKAYLYVSTSNYEGLCNSMLEALAMGVPSVVTDCPSGGARDMVTPYENGLLIPVGDSRALYEGMKEIVENPELWKKMSRNAQSIREKLEMSKITDAWLDIMR